MTGRAATSYMCMDRVSAVRCLVCFFLLCVLFFQAEDGIRDLVRSRGLGDVYKRQADEHLHLQRLDMRLHLDIRAEFAADGGLQPAGDVVRLSLIHI